MIPLDRIVPIGIGEDEVQKVIPISLVSTSALP